MKTLRCTASSLVVRDAPAGTDTGRRILQGQEVTADGESDDHAWTHVAIAAGPGWVSTKYLAEAVQDLSAQTLELATGMSPTDAARWLPPVLEASTRFDFGEPLRLAMWLAQCA